MFANWAGRIVGISTINAMGKGRNSVLTSATAWTNWILMELILSILRRDAILPHPTLIEERFAA